VRRYSGVLEFIGGNDPALGRESPSSFSVTMLRRKRQSWRSLLESWFYPMHLGHPLPILPVWLAADLCITLDLASSYRRVSFSERCP
jgi:hypothetical protein